MFVESFKALVLESEGRPDVRPLTMAELPPSDVTVSVAYSSVNYKDALAVTGSGKIIRSQYPIVPGIDLAGRVLSSQSADFAPGDEIILTGGGLGESIWGGYSQVQAVPAKYIVPLPSGMSLRTSMILGTAGLTAMLSVLALEAHGIVDGTVVVTGASGGVGMISVYLLSELRYRVVASCGSRHLWHKLQALGAERCEDRLHASKSLERGVWDGAVDAAGGVQLAAILAGLRPHGCVAASGNAGGAELRTTVYPFILRGVTLAGISSNTASAPDRRMAWKRLRELITEEVADRLLMATIQLSEVPSVCAAKIASRAPGRFLVNMADGSSYD